MSLINKEISEFCVQAYHNKAFKEVKKRMCWQMEYFLLLSGGLYFCVPDRTGGPCGQISGIPSDRM